MFAGLPGSGRIRSKSFRATLSQAHCFGPTGNAERQGSACTHDEVVEFVVCV